MSFDLEWPDGRPPEGLEDIIRKELPSLADEIVAAIRRQVPEYRRRPAGPYGRLLRGAVELIVAEFPDWLLGSPPEDGPCAAVCREIGEFEAMEGRELDALHAALRIAAQTSWHRVVTVITQYEVDALTTTLLADAMLNYLDELAQVCRAAHQAARARMDEDLAKRRRWLLHQLADPSPGGGAGDGDDGGAALAAQAEAAGWPLPGIVTPVAVRPGSLVVRAVLDADLLADLTDPEPLLLIPGPVTAEREAMLADAVDEGNCAVGVGVPPDRVPDSLRWARRTLALVVDGLLPDAPVVRAEEHLLTLAVHADVRLVERLAERLLAPLWAMPERRRDRLVDTLRSLLRTRGNAQEMAAELGIHEQTVHYRMRQLEEAIGDRLADPETRFATEVAVRVLWPGGADAKGPMNSAPGTESGYSGIDSDPGKG